MHWIAPSERDTASDTLEKRLWNAADQFRANSGLTAAQYSAPVLGLIFLLFAETRFAKRRAELLPSPAGDSSPDKGRPGGVSRRASNRADEPAAYHAESVIFLPETARFAHLLNLPEGANVGQAINDAMAEIEKHNPQLAGVLPRTYQIFTSTLLKELLKKVSEIPVMARSLYREWFVHFRYPGHEFVPFADSPLGQIPQGWEVKPAPGCIVINPRVTVPRDGEKPFVPMGCLSNDSMLISDIESRSGNSGAKFQNGDTLFARITPCLENGKTGFVQFLPNSQDVAFGSTEFIVLRSRTLTPEFVYCLARSDEFRNAAIKSMSGATGRQRVQEECFDAYQIAQPPRELLDRFSEIVSPSFRLIYRFQHQIENLRRTRDLLLPRLLSGNVHLLPEDSA